MAEELELKVAPKEVDINDLQLADEQVTVNPEADAFAGPPPPDDGDHRVKLSLGPRKVMGGKGKQGNQYYMVHLQGKIQPGDKFEGRITFDNVSTMVMQNTGTSSIIGVLKALGEPVGRNVSIVEITRQLTSRLAGEPEVIQKTQWTVFCAECKDEFTNTKGRSGKKNGIMLRGQNRFPQVLIPNENGGEPTKLHRHQIECPGCGSLLSAQASVVDYKPAQ